MAAALKDVEFHRNVGLLPRRVGFQSLDDRYLWIVGSGRNERGWTRRTYSHAVGHRSINGRDQIGSAFGVRGPPMNRWPVQRPQRRQESNIPLKG